MWIRSAGETYHIRQNVAIRTPTSGVPQTQRLFVPRKLPYKRYL